MKRRFTEPGFSERECLSKTGAFQLGLTIMAITEHTMTGMLL